jgi:hypothetical protein
MAQATTCWHCSNGPARSLQVTDIVRRGDALRVALCPRCIATPDRWSGWRPKNAEGRVVTRPT